MNFICSINMDIHIDNISMEKGIDIKYLGVGWRYESMKFKKHVNKAINELSKRKVFL